MNVADGAFETHDDEISALIETLHRTEERLEELTAGEVDSVTDREGRTFLLRRAQEQLLVGVVARQAAILNALPAHIAMIDAQGSIISVNEAWQRFATENLLQGPGSAIGVNYLDICDCAWGEDCSEARLVAAGIRAVLRGENKSFSCEYPCHSPSEQRWFSMTVTPFADDPPSGAVVMHLDVTAERLAEVGAQLVVESSLDAVVVIDASDHVAVWNTQAEKTFGWSRHQAVGKLLTELIIPARYQEAHNQGMRMFLQNGAGPILGKRVEMVARHQDGHEFPVELAVSPVRLRGSWIFNASIRDLTEKTRNKALLERCSAAMDATPDAIYLVDRATMRYVYVNDAACSMRKHTREQLLALGPAGLLAIPEAELAREYDNIIASGKPAEPVEMLRPRDDSSPAWVELRRHAQRFGNDWMIVSIARNITKRKRVAAKLQESERRFSDMMGNVELMSIIIDTQGRIIYCNDYFLALTGWRGDELLGQKYVDLIIPPELADEVREVHSAMVANSPAARHHENEIMTRSGKRQLIRWNNTVLCSSAGEVIGTASIGEDITERKRSEEALLASEVQQRHLIEQLKVERSRLVAAQRVAKVGSWQTDLVTMTVIWSDETHRIYETDPATFQPTHAVFLDLVHPEDRDMVEKAFELSLAGRSANQIIEHRLQFADGRIKCVEERWQVYGNEQEKLPLAVGTCQDITERKHTENEIRRLNEDLERRVDERTAELQAVNQELEAFDYSVSHDLRVPIRHVEGFSTILLDDYREKLDARGIDHLNRIHGAAERMSQLVSDLLALSLVSRGELHRTGVDLSALAQLVFADLQKAAPEREIECVVQPGLSVNADRGLLRIVLENLIGNARKFSAGRNDVKIEFGCTSAEGRRVYFVCDNGAGFDAAYADQLFAPFKRLHAQTAFKGTGIGLATVRRIITRHGGEVWAEGIVDQGATIYFTLP